MQPREDDHRNTVGIQYGFFAQCINTVYYSEEEKGMRRDRKNKRGNGSRRAGKRKGKEAERAKDRKPESVCSCRREGEGGRCIVCLQAVFFSCDFAAY